MPNIKNTQQNRPNADFPIWSIFYHIPHTRITISSYISYPISSYKKEYIYPTPQQPSPYLQARKQPLPHLPLAKSTKFSSSPTVKFTTKSQLCNCKVAKFP